MCTCAQAKACIAKYTYNKTRLLCSFVPRIKMQTHKIVHISLLAFTNYHSNADAVAAQ